MKNPRSPGDKHPIKKSIEPKMDNEKMIKLMNDFCEVFSFSFTFSSWEEDN
jgi:hypothetical protein